MKTVKKTLALLLALVLLISVTPMVAIATLWSGGGEGNYTSAELDLSGFARSELSDISVEYVVEHLTDYSGDPIEVDGSVVAYAKGEYYSSNSLDDFVLIGAPEYIPRVCIEKNNRHVNPFHFMDKRN